VRGEAEVHLDDAPVRLRGRGEGRARVNEAAGGCSARAAGSAPRLAPRSHAPRSVPRPQTAASRRGTRTRARPAPRCPPSGRGPCSQSSRAAGSRACRTAWCGASSARAPTSQSRRF
jgi:hypothetical protein